MPRWRSHSGPGHDRRRSADDRSRSSRTRKSLPSPWCLVERAGSSWSPPVSQQGGDNGEWILGRPVPRDPRVAPPPHPLAAGEARVRRDRLGRGRRQGDPAPRGGRAPPGSRGPGGRCGTARPAGPPGAGPRRPGRRPPWSAKRSVDAPGDDRLGAATARPDGTAVGREGRDARAEAGKGPAAARRSPPGPARPGGGWSAPSGRRPAGRVGSQASVQGGGVGLGLQLGPDVGVPAGRRQPSTTAWKYRPVPPTSRARWPRASMPARPPGPPR